MYLNYVREKQKLHVLPGGFVDRREETHKRILPGPVVNKMKKRPGNRDKENADDGKFSQILHSALLTR